MVKMPISPHKGCHLSKFIFFYFSDTFGSYPSSNSSPFKSNNATAVPTTGSLMDLDFLMKSPNPAGAAPPPPSSTNPFADPFALPSSNSYQRPPLDTWGNNNGYEPNQNQGNLYPNLANGNGRKGLLIE